MSCVVLEKLLDLSGTGEGYNLGEFCWTRDHVGKVLSVVPDMQPPRGDQNPSFGADLCSRPGHDVSFCAILGKLLMLCEPGKQISMIPITQ